MYRKLFKPVVDLLVASFGFLFLIPIFLILILLVAVCNSGHVFFTQIRTGKNGVLFKLLKFKTMTDECDSNGILLPDGKRITKIGKFLRVWSLDELPQLINVIKGDLSMVGPRPLLPEYIPLYNKFQVRRLEVKPGITGWAQISGRNSISWQTRFELDIWYIDNLSLVLDIKILYLTIMKIIKREGINSSNVMTMSPFKGNEN